MLSIFLAIWVNLIGMCLQQVAASPFSPHYPVHRQLLQDSEGPQIVGGRNVSEESAPQAGAILTVTVTLTVTSPIINTVLGISTFSVFTTTSTVTRTVPTSTTTTTFLFTPSPSIVTSTAATVIFEAVSTIVAPSTRTPPMPTPTSPSIAVDVPTSESPSLARNGSGSTNVIRGWGSSSWMCWTVALGVILVI